MSEYREILRKLEEMQENIEDIVRRLKRIEDTTDNIYKELP